MQNKGQTTKSVLVDIPLEWMPEIDARKEQEGRSRHNMILRLIRAGLDQGE